VGTAIVIRSGYVPLAFGSRRLCAASADAAILFAVIARYALLARRIDQPAALLAVPEVATVLSTTVAAIDSQ
jgi:tryptophan-rich sensory protein